MCSVGTRGVLCEGESCSNSLDCYSNICSPVYELCMYADEQDAEAEGEPADLGEYCYSNSDCYSPYTCQGERCFDE